MHLLSAENLPLALEINRDLCEIGSRLPCSKRRAVLVRVPGRCAVAEINVGILDDILLRPARSNLQDQSEVIGTVL